MNEYLVILISLIVSKGLCKYTCVNSLYQSQNENIVSEGDVTCPSNSKNDQILS